MSRLTCGSLCAPAGHQVLNPRLRPGAAWAPQSADEGDGLSLTSSCTHVGFNNIKLRLPEI